MASILIETGSRWTAPGRVLLLTACLARLLFSRLLLCSLMLLEFLTAGRAADEEGNEKHADTSMDHGRFTLKRETSTKSR